MKKLMLILPVVALGLTGCVVYQPSPTAGQYGYTYDYQVPIAEGTPAPTYSGVPEPRRTDRYFVPTPVVADAPPSPPTTPPIVSSIPELTPRPIIQNRTTTMVYPQQSPVIREGAGADADARTQAAGAPGYAPGTTVLSGALPLIVGNVPTNAPTNGTPTNGIPTNGVPTNGIPTNGIPTNNIPTNNIPTNGFRPLPGTNVNEGAGAQNTNAVPQRIEPAPRLPAQPTIPEGQNPIPAPSPNTAAPQGAQQPSQSFAPVAPVTGQPAGQPATGTQQGTQTP